MRRMGRIRKWPHLRHTQRQARRPRTRAGEGRDWKLIPNLLPARGQTFQMYICSAVVSGVITDPTVMWISAFT
jgi:hypothetical protein